MGKKGGVLIRYPSLHDFIYLQCARPVLVLRVPGLAPKEQIVSAVSLKPLLIMFPQAWGQPAQPWSVEWAVSPLYLLAKHSTCFLGGLRDSSIV